MVADILKLWHVFRWFKFTLKPPYTIMHGNFLSTIWDTSHWTSFVKFRLKTAWDISYDILWPILKDVNFWWLQGCLSNLSKKDAFRKLIFFLHEGAMRLQWGLGVLGGQVPRLYGGTIFGGCDMLGVSGKAFSAKAPFSWHICGSLEGTRLWLIWSRISPQVWTRVL